MNARQKVTNYRQKIFRFCERIVGEPILEKGRTTMAHKFLSIKTKRATEKIFLDDIIYIEKDRSRAKLITVDKERIIYSNMQDIRRHMDERFLSCHRSYLFNMDKIICMTNQTIYMEQGYQTQLGRETFRRGRRMFDQYLDKSL